MCSVRMICEWLFSSWRIRALMPGSGRDCAPQRGDEREHQKGRGETSEHGRMLTSGRRLRI